MPLLLLLLLVMMTALSLRLRPLRTNHRPYLRALLTASAADEAIALTDDIQELRKERVFAYDTATLNLAEKITVVLQEMIAAARTDASELPIYSLNAIHFHSYANETIVDGSGAVLNKLQYTWNLYRDRSNIPLQHASLLQAYADFDALYDRFIKEEIAPHIVSSCGNRTVVYQSSPSLRIYQPSSVALGKLHCDEDYHHQPSELNYWVPISERCFGSNSLWTESEALKGDFRPLDLHRGEYFRFYGNKCRHKTVPNDSNTTRVSLDFRALSDRTGGHDPTFRKGVRRGSKAKYSRSFDIGGFYKAVSI